MAKPSFAEFVSEDRRLVILRTLDVAPGYRLNEHVLKTALQHLGHNVGTDTVRAEAIWLKDHGLVRTEEVEMDAGTLWIVRLTEAGQMVAQGRYHPGVKRPSAD